MGGGRTLNEGTARNRFTGEESDATFVSDPVTKGTYRSDLSFKPDSNYGLQLTVDLQNGLSAIAQFTGSGGQKFNASVAWAYVSYEVNDDWTVQAGRQRLPLFFYSDSMEVGYSYHWIRPPQELSQIPVDTIEGLKISWTPILGDFDARIELFGGAGDEPFSTGEGTPTLKDLIGITGRISNDWLQLRASYAQTVYYLDLPPGIFSKNGIPQATVDDPFGAWFYGFAARMAFGGIFVMSEYGVGDLEDAFAPDLGLSGSEKEVGWYISSGIRIGAFTPHITYGESRVPISADGIATGLTKDADSAASSITLGLRWDFHPRAAFKVEYLTRSDKSDDAIRNAHGACIPQLGCTFPGPGPAGGHGHGRELELDLITIGVDVVF